MTLNVSKLSTRPCGAKSDGLWAWLPRAIEYFKTVNYVTVGDTAVSPFAIEIYKNEVCD